MRRRAALAAGAAVILGGCIGRGDARSVPATLDAPPDGVYVPTHGADLAVVDVATAGGLSLALCYSYPSRFWELTGQTTYRRDAEDEVHLMVVAWEPESGVVLPELGITTEVTRDGETVFHEAVYPMVSQRLGFHYGDNAPLPRDGRYEVTVAVGGTSIRRTGAFEGRFGGGTSHTFAFEYARAERNELSTSRPANAGELGALPPADVADFPVGVAPSLPGRVLSAGSSDDARIDVAVVPGDMAARFDAETYLAVSPRTPYNGMLLPAMGIHGRVDRDGEPVFVGALERTLDPELGYHYGAAVPGVRDGDRVVVEPLTPPQVARHEGYETAFVEMDPVGVEVGG